MSTRVVQNRVDAVKQQLAKVQQMLDSGYNSDIWRELDRLDMCCQKLYQYAREQLRKND